MSPPLSFAIFWLHSHQVVVLNSYSVIMAGLNKLSQIIKERMSTFRDPNGAFSRLIFSRATKRSHQSASALRKSLSI